MAAIAKIIISCIISACTYADIKASNTKKGLLDTGAINISIDSLVSKKGVKLFELISFDSSKVYFVRLYKFNESRFKRDSSIFSALVRNTCKDFTKKFHVVFVFYEKYINLAPTGSKDSFGNVLEIGSQNFEEYINILNTHKKSHLVSKILRKGFLIFKYPHESKTIHGS